LLKSNKKFTKMGGKMKEAGPDTPMPRNSPDRIFDTLPGRKVDPGQDQERILQFPQDGWTGSSLATLMFTFRWHRQRVHRILDVGGTNAAACGMIRRE
jgi:hypothetical protein